MDKERGNISETAPVNSAWEWNVLRFNALDNLHMKNLTDTLFFISFGFEIEMNMMS